MSMRRRIATAGVAGILGVTGLVAVTAPLASAETTTEDGASAVGSRLQAIKDALAGLVGDGSITQEQADEVATTLDGSDALRGPGGHGPGGGRGVSTDAAAEALGMTAEELRTALEVDGTTLADVAEAQGVETATLVDALVSAATERIEGKVTEGRITQEQADVQIAVLPDRIAALVEKELRFGGPGGRGGHGPRGGGPTDAPTDAPTDDAPTDDAPTDDAATDDAPTDDAATADGAVFSGTTV
jgi:hypothetical protein